MGTSASAQQPARRLGLTPLRLLPDRTLAGMAARGDTRAFEAIFERYHQELYRYCRAVLRDPHEAHDALQNAMVAALRSLPGEERKIALRPWLYRVAHNEAISIARRRSAPAPQPAAPEAAPTAEADAAERERLRELVSDLGALPDRQRGAIVMRELSGLSYREIAGALGVGEGAARQTVYEAREAMRQAARGREMECRAVRRAISERDGRILRGRTLRAHLRACEGCQDYRLAISQRRHDLQALAAPLSPLAASALLAGVFGKGAGAVGAGALGAAGGATVGVSKGAALVAATVLGAGAVGITGAVDLPGGGASGEGATSGRGNPAAAGERAPAAEPGLADENARRSGQQRSPESQAAAGDGDRGKGQAPDRGSGGTDHPPAAAPASEANGNGQEVPAGGSDGETGPPAHANGNGPPASAGTGDRRCRRHRHILTRELRPLLALANGHGALQRRQRWTARHASGTGRPHD